MRRAARGAEPAAVRGAEERAPMAARLPYLDRAQVPSEIQSLYDTLQAGSGRVLNIFRLMARHGRSLPPFHAWYPRLREGPLDLRLRYLAYVRASQLNRCRYCVTHNGPAGRKAGIPKGQLEALADHRTRPLFSELERRAIASAAAITTA